MQSLHTQVPASRYADHTGPTSNQHSQSMKKQHVSLIDANPGIKVYILCCICLYSSQWFAVKISNLIFLFNGFYWRTTCSVHVLRAQWAASLWTAMGRWWTHSLSHTHQQTVHFNHSVPGAPFLPRSLWVFPKVRNASLPPLFKLYYIYITFYLNTTGTNWWWPEHCASMFPVPCSCVLPGKILVWLKINLFELVVLHLRPTSTIVKHTWIKQTGTSQLLLASLLVLNERVLFSVT